MKNKVQKVLSMIDHAALHPSLSQQQIAQEIEVAINYDVASICVQPSWVPLSVKQAKGRIAVCTVIGFPQGVSFKEIKIAEAVRALSEGAMELDMVIHIGKAMSGEWGYVQDEVNGVAEVCNRHDAILKVILETDYLKDPDLIQKACASCVQANADFVKTSTGFGFVKGADGRYSSQGAQKRHIQLMRETVGPHVGVKASGGIRSLEDALIMVDAGASRLGTSSTEKIAGHLG